jgi:hypothetical protein
MTPQEQKVAQYHRQWEGQNRISLWFALAILTIPIIGLGVFFTLANGSAKRAPPAIAHALHFGDVNANQHAPRTPPITTETTSNTSR